MMGNDTLMLVPLDRLAESPMNTKKSKPKVSKK